MHTTQINETTFTHYGDFSGDISIIRNDKAIIVPFEDIKDFMAEYIRTKQIKMIEEMDFDQLASDLKHINTILSGMAHKTP
jgi:hypothetical protein